MSIRRFRLPVLIAASVALLLSAAPSHAGPNLLPNSDFELSAIEPVPALQGKQPQPLLPTGWAFEGVAGLFDHSPHGGSGGSARAATISIPAGGKSKICGPEIGCPNNPATDPKNSANLAYSVNPAWRNAAPVAVSAGTFYTVAADISWVLMTQGEGAFAKVRWMNSAGVPISVSGAIDTRETGIDGYRFWERATGTVKAPAGAASAVVLFGATDDIFISQVLFDKVFFG